MPGCLAAIVPQRPGLAIFALAEQRIIGLDHIRRALRAVRREGRFGDRGAIVGQAAGGAGLGRRQRLRRGVGVAAAAGVGSTGAATRCRLHLAIGIGIDAALRLSMPRR